MQCNHIIQRGQRQGQICNQRVTKTVLPGFRDKCCRHYRPYLDPEFLAYLEKLRVETMLENERRRVERNAKLANSIRIDNPDEYHVIVDGQPYLVSEVIDDMYVDDYNAYLV